MQTAPPTTIERIPPQAYSSLQAAVSAGHLTFDRLYLPRPRVWVALVLATYLALGLLYALRTPDWQAPDEPAHYNNIAHIAQTGTLPVLKMGDYNQELLDFLLYTHFAPKVPTLPLRYEAYQPPLYYVLATPIFWLTQGNLLALRFFNLLLGALGLWLLYAGVATVFPNKTLISGGALAFAALLPMQIAVAAAVNNDVLAQVTVIGAPGCARSPKENGFDWVLDRLLAGLPVTAQTIAGLGVGGLLMEIATRPQPRETGVINPDTVLRVDALVLAAGKSSRMGGPNKLLAQFSGEPLIRKVVKAATDSEAASVTVVSGHQAEAVGRALEGCGAAVVHNQDFAEGLATSLRTGLAALPNGADGALVILGDMPGVTAGLMDRLIATFRGQGGQAVVRAMHGGKRGNPVILPASIFDQARLLTGDTGARHLVEMSGLPVIDIEAGDAALLDVDTPEALAAAGGRLPPEGD